ncbi:hypothetical protein ACHAPJ_009626 [Fusarium lateritium]
MDVQPQQDAAKIQTNRRSALELSALLAHSNADEAKRLQGKARSVLQGSFSILADVDAIDILKVIGITHNGAQDTRWKIIELCISSAFPLVILECRLLVNLLSSLSLLDDQGPVADKAKDSDHVPIFKILAEEFGYVWRWRWRDVFSRWQGEVQDSEWLDNKVRDFTSNLTQIQMAFSSIKEALNQIHRWTGISLEPVSATIAAAIDLFNTCLADCSTKANELRIEQERSKYLASSSGTSDAHSWKGADLPASGNAQEISFEIDCTSPGVMTERGTAKTINKRWSGLRRRSTIDCDLNKDHWTRVFDHTRLPVIVFLIAAMAPTIYSTIICETPDALPALDSNFYSTLSQCISSFAGLWVIIKPVSSPNEKDKVKTRFPNVFNTMLALSLLTSVASVVSYAWSPRVSIPLAYASGLALNIATLLIIQDSGNQIRETNEEVAYLENILAERR